MGQEGRGRFQSISWYHFCASSIQSSQRGQVDVTMYIGYVAFLFSMPLDDKKKIGTPPKRLLATGYLCPPKIHGEALIPSVMILGNGAFGR